MVRAADPDMRWQVNEILDTSKAMGLKVLRTWAFSEGPLQYNSLQRYPGACPAPGAAAAPPPGNRAPALEALAARVAKRTGAQALTRCLRRGAPDGKLTLEVTTRKPISSEPVTCALSHLRPGECAYVCGGRRRASTQQAAAPGRGARTRQG